MSMQAFTDTMREEPRGAAGIAALQGARPRPGGANAMNRLGCAILIAASLGACAPHGPKGTIATLEPPAAVDWAAARPVEIVLADFSFTPETLLLEEERPYRLRFLNQGSGTHDFSAPDFFRTVA